MTEPRGGYRRHPEFDPMWDVARDKDGHPITITEDQLHAIWHAIGVVEQVRTFERTRAQKRGESVGRGSGMSSLWDNPSPNLYKSRLLGRMLLGGRPPTRTKPPHNVGAPDWSLLPGGDPFGPAQPPSEDVLAAIAGALDDGHGEPENDHDAAVAVVMALFNAGFVIQQRSGDIDGTKDATGAAPSTRSHVRPVDRGQGDKRESPALSGPAPAPPEDIDGPPDG